MHIKSWLRRNPQPVKVRVDGEKVIAVGESPRRWSDLLKTLEAIDWTTLECLDEHGDVLRAHGEAAEEAEEDDRTDMERSIAAVAHELRLCMEASFEAATKQQNSLLENLVGMVNSLSVQASKTQELYCAALVRQAEAEARAVEAQSNGQEPAMAALLARMGGGIAGGGGGAGGGA